MTNDFPLLSYLESSKALVASSIHAMPVMPEPRPPTVFGQLDNAAELKRVLIHYSNDKAFVDLLLPEPPYPATVSAGEALQKKIVMFAAMDLSHLFERTRYWPGRPLAQQDPLMAPSIVHEYILGMLSDRRDKGLFADLTLRRMMDWLRGVHPDVPGLLIEGRVRVFHDTFCRNLMGHAYGLQTLNYPL